METHHQFLQVMHTAYFPLLLTHIHSTIGGKTPKTASQQKDLGTNRNNNLPWSAHITAVCGKSLLALPD